MKFAKFLKNTLLKFAPIRRARENYLKRIHTFGPATRLIPRYFSEHAPFDAYFVTSQGIKLPVYDSYRYKLTGGLTYLPQLEFMRQLNLAGLLSKNESAYYYETVGSRTLTRPLDELTTITSSLIEKFEDKLAKETMGMNTPPHLAPSDPELNAKIRQFASLHSQTLDHVVHFTGKRVPAKGHILEIGFTSGGHSNFALEQLGFQVTGGRQCVWRLHEPTAISYTHRKSTGIKMRICICRHNATPAL